jgi:CRISPR system Cascade subunit CasE
MFLSRASLEFKVARGFNALYLTHQLVADLFGDREDRGYLYRVMKPIPGGAQVLVLSVEAPNPTSRPRQWGWVRGVETRAYDITLRSDQVVDYEVRINATQVFTADSGHKKRLDVWDAQFAADPSTPLSPHDVYRAYLQRKLADSSDVLAGRVVGRGERTASRIGQKPIRFVATDVIGVLRIRDPARFMEHLTAGVGRVRAFGCGLLCLSAPGTVLPRRYGTLVPESAT